MSSMSSDDRDERRKFLLNRIAENRKQLKEVLGRAPEHAAPRSPVPPPAGMADPGSPEAAARAFAGADYEAPRTFPRSRTMRWAIEHPAEAALIGAAGAALLGLGPVKLARWMRSSRSTRASAGFMHGVREGVNMMQPLVPLLTAWLGHKWRTAERHDSAHDPGAPGRRPY